MKNLFVLATLILLVGCSSPSYYISVTGEANPTRGYKEMCVDNTELNICSSKIQSNYDSKISQQNLDKFREIHNKIYERFTYVSDQKQFNTPEKWVYPSQNYNVSQRLHGDCEEFAFAVSKAAEDAGIEGVKLLFLFDGGKFIAHVVVMYGDRISDVNHKRMYSLDQSIIQYKYDIQKLFDFDTNTWHSVAVKNNLK